MKKRLAGILAGECTHYEEIKIERHLSYCPRCAQELKNLKEVDSLLDSLAFEMAPPDLFNSIMENVEKAAAGRNRQPERTLPDSASIHAPAKRSLYPGVLRDLVSAAAAVIVIFWLGAGWFGSLTGAAEKNISRVVLSYVHFTGTALNQTQNSIYTLNNDLLSTMGKLNFSQNLSTGK